MTRAVARAGLARRVAVAVLLAALAAQAAQLGADEPPGWEDAGLDGADIVHAGTIAHAGSRAATLDADNSRLVFHSDPARWDVIGNLVVLGGRLLASASFDFSEGRALSAWAYSDRSQLLEFDPAADRWTVVGDLDKSMIFNVRVIDGRLLVPEYYPWTADRVSAFDGRTWSELGKLPGPMLHGMDVCAFRGRLLWSGSWRATSVDATLADPNWYGGYGKVYESADAGATWREIYSDAKNGRMQDMVVFRDRVYCNRRGQTLMRWDGATWTEVPVGVPTRPGETAVLGNALLHVFGDAILAASPPIAYRYDGTTWTSTVPGFLRLFTDGALAYGLRDDGHVYQSRDGRAWTRMTTTGVPREEFDRQARFGRPLRRGAVALYHGRLHVGTGATGKLYAAAYVPAGTITSGPRPTSGVAALSWTAEVPDGTTLRAQIRSARTAAELGRATWSGALDSSPAVVGIPHDHAWMQYRFSLASTDGRHTPAVRTVAWGR